MRRALVVLALTACTSEPLDGGPDDPSGKGDGFDSDAASERAEAVAALLDDVRDNATALRAWLVPLPKGADLHSHLSGAVPTESLIAWGAADSNCVSVDHVASSGPCMTGSTSMVGLDAGDALWTELVRAWSLEGNQSRPVAERHAHFFAAFGKFFSVTRRRNVDMLVEARRAAARDRVQYVELMIGLGSSVGGRVGQRHLTAGGMWNTARLTTGRAAILGDAEIATTITRTRADLAAWDRDSATMLGCAGSSPEPACDVEVRYLVQAVRAQPREHVFGQFVYGFALAAADPSVVGLNLVQAEEDPVSLANYRDQMIAIGFLTKAEPAVKVSLHAGELTSEFASPDHLAFHVSDAALVAGASRIGHAVDILGEDDAADLVTEMARRGILVEACLTSNHALLDVEGGAHPIGELLRRGVPVALATDDQGILRASMTDELVRAVRAQGLGYHHLKRMIRASVAHSFLPGKRLRDLAGCRAALIAEELDASCTSALATSERASAEWKLEAALDAFERDLVD
jgi:adenosine deaminase